MMDVKKSIGFFIVIFLFIQGGFAGAQVEGSNQDNDSILFPSDFFDIKEPLEISLEFDIRKYKNTKPKEYLPATLKYSINSGIEISKSVKVKARGEYRREHCMLSPYWLNIKGADISDEDISGFGKIKVVTHCKDSKTYTEYLLKEFIAYKLYNIVADYSFKVRLLKIKYIDTGRNNKASEDWAFMIEPEDMLTERYEAYPLKIDNIRYRQADTLRTTIMSVFQYMIGNTDYSVAGRHNVKILTLKDFTKPELIVIPYDFDFSGLVNAFYALPSKKIDITKVTQRYYYGMCRSDELYNIVLDLFREKKDEIFNFVNTFEYIDNKTKKSVISYLEDFYEEIERPNFIRNKFRTTCEK